MTENNIKLSIIIINWNTKQLLLDCVASIYSTVGDAPFELFVVDNASTDDSVEAVSQAYPYATVIVNTSNLGFARANNVAIRRMRGEYAVLLNSDTVLKKTAIDSLIEFMEQHPEAGMCGPQLLNSDGTNQNSFGAFPLLLTEFISKSLVRFVSPKTFEKVVRRYPPNFNEPTPVDFIVGACMVVRKRAIDAVGMLDEDYFFLYEETDWCYRMHRAGWLVYHVPDVKIYHLGSQSMKEVNLRSRVESWQSRYMFFKKNLQLSSAAWIGLLALGFMQNAYQFLLYSLLNLITLFSIKRLRRRWVMFAYLLLWHVRRRPVSMGIPR
jgi:GT2 family glycosyltransferase